MSDDEIVLRLDRTTARYLLGALHDLGEHLAAGVPMGPLTADENDRLATLILELHRSLKHDESGAAAEPQESAATSWAEGDGENDDEDEILARATSARQGARWAVRRLKTVAHEEEIIVDLPAIAVAAKVHAGLTAMKYPLLPGQLATVDGHYRVRWIDDGGADKQNPVLITVRAANEAYGTALRIRGAAKEGLIEQRSAQKRVDPLTGILCDLFEKSEIIDVTD